METCSNWKEEWGIGNKEHEASKQSTQNEVVVEVQIKTSCFGEER